MQLLSSRLSVAAAPPPAHKQVVSTEDRWGDTLSILLKLFDMTAPTDPPPPIWDVISHLSRDRDQSAMVEACCQKAEHLRFRSPYISHTAAVLVLGLAFYFEDRGGVVDAINVFLFSYLSP